MNKNPLVKETSIEEDVAKARAAQKMLRKIAPEIGVNAAYKDPRQVLVERCVPEAMGRTRNKFLVKAGSQMKVIGGTGATHSAMFADPRNYTEKLAQGWEPVVIDGDVQQDNGDILMKRPIEFTQTQLKQEAAQSAERVKSRDMESENNEMMDDYRKEMAGKDHLKEQTAVTTGVVPTRTDEDNA